MISTKKGKGEIINGNRNYQITYFPRRKTLFGNSIELLPLLYFIKNRRKYDLVHIHSHLPFISLTIAILCILFNKKYVITNHGLYSQSAPNWLNKFYLLSFGKLIFKYSKSVYTYTNFEKFLLHIVCSVDLKKIKVIPNCINIEKLSKYVKNYKKEYDVLSIGRHVVGKGHDIFIDTLIELKSEKFNLKACIIGDGPLFNKNVKKATTHGLDIDFIKFVQNDEIFRFYQKSRVFLLLSKTEGFPKVFLEAYYFGLPIICSFLPQLKSYIENGFGELIINRKDINEIKYKLKKIKLNPRKVDPSVLKSIVTNKHSLNRYVKVLTEDMLKVISNY